MLLKELIEDIKVEKVVGSLDKEIKTISQDSRDGDFFGGLYIAVSGTNVDGHNYIDDVLEKGAIAVICEIVPEMIKKTVTYILVHDSRNCVGKIASAFYAHPSKDLKVIAITGTDGKTSVASYLSQSLQKLGEKTLLLSTAGDYFDEKKIELNRKAPSSLEAIELHKIMREYLDKGVHYVCLEATSQALDQDRLAAVDIDVAIFTNLGRDHIDYHKTIEHYRDSKKRLFDNLKSSALSISNYDDDFGMYILQDTKSEKRSYGVNNEYDYSFYVESMSLGSIVVNINSHQLTVPVIGEFNIYNILSVYAVLIELNFDNSSVISLLENIKGVPGRMEQIKNNHNILTLVDYAHSPNALESVLKTLQVLPHNKITTIIGCGGDRDRTKRAPMAKISQLLSNFVIYTADNPRTEDLNQIFDDMKLGVDISNENYQFVNNREDAIQQAIQQSSSGDVVLIAGKGHEDYQIIGTEKIHFDDREVARKFLESK